jgi:hypothetical protein
MNVTHASQYDSVPLIGLNDILAAFNQGGGEDPVLTVADLEEGDIFTCPNLVDRNGGKGKDLYMKIGDSLTKKRQVNEGNSLYVILAETADGPHVGYFEDSTTPSNPTPFGQQHVNVLRRLVGSPFA